MFIKHVLFCIGSCVVASVVYLALPQSVPVEKPYEFTAVHLFYACDESKSSLKRKYSSLSMGIYRKKISANRVEEYVVWKAARLKLKFLTLQGEISCTKHLPCNHLMHIFDSALSAPCTNFPCIELFPCTVWGRSLPFDRSTRSRSPSLHQPEGRFTVGARQASRR